MINRRVSSRSNDAHKKSKKFSKVVAQGQQLRSMIRINDDAQSSSNIPLKKSVGVSLLSKNIGFGADKRKTIHSQMDQCREAQFKSNFHQTSYGWRHVLENTEPQEIDLPEDPLMSCPIIEIDDMRKRSIADSEVLTESTNVENMEYLFDFDVFFEGMKEQSDCKEGLTDSLQLDEELLQLLM